MPEPLNALTALALARKTGCKVRPSNYRLPEISFYYIDGELYHGDGDTWSMCSVHPRFLHNPDGTPVEWIVVEEGATL